MMELYLDILPKIRYSKKELSIANFWGRCFPFGVWLARANHGAHILP